MDNVPLLLFRRRKNYIRDKGKVFLRSPKLRAKKEDIQALPLFFLN